MISDIITQLFANNAGVQNHDDIDLLKGQPERADIKTYSDQQLLEKLREYDIEIDRAMLGTLCELHPDMDSFVKPWIDKASERQEPNQEDLELEWIPDFVMELCNRWFPEAPLFARFVDKVESGFFFEDGHDVEICRNWMEAFEEFIRIADKTQMDSFEDFDLKVDSLRCTMHWLIDFILKLEDMGRNEKPFHEQRIFVCGELLKRFPDEDPKFVRFLKRTLAKSYWELGAEETAVTLFKTWLTEDPKWGAGYVNLARLYDTKSDTKVLRTMEEILRGGLGVSKVRDRVVILYQLASLLRCQGRYKEATLLYNKIERMPPYDPDKDPEGQTYENCSCGEPAEEEL